MNNRKPPNYSHGPRRAVPIPTCVLLGDIRNYYIISKLSLNTQVRSWKKRKTYTHTASSNMSGTDFNRHVPIKIPKFNRHVLIKILIFNRHVSIKIIFFTKHLPIKEMRRQSSKFTKDHTNTTHTTKDTTFWMQTFRGEDQKSHSWRQKWATGWPSLTLPTRSRGSSKSQIQ